MTTAKKKNEIDWSTIVEAIPAAGQPVEGVGTIAVIAEGEAMLKIPAAHAQTAGAAVLWVIASQLDMIELAKVGSAASARLKDMLVDAMLASSR